VEFSNNKLAPAALYATDCVEGKFDTERREALTPDTDL